jgi:hypothetical protein
MLGRETIRASYRYTPLAKRTERIHLEVPSADLNEIEAILEPALQPQGLLARLRLSRRAIPGWLAARDLEGDAVIGQFSINHANLGPLSSHFVWQAGNVDFDRVQLNLPEGLIRAHGSVNMESYLPQYQFTAKVTGFAWRGGLLSADAQVESSGTGVDCLENMRANGTFSGEDLALSPEDVFSRLSGTFEYSFADGWPNLRLSQIRASDGSDAWDGEAASQSDGKLIFDLEHDGHQRRVISTLLPGNSNSPTVSSLSNAHGSDTQR